MEIESHCALCFELIEPSQTVIRCKRCPLILHLDCFFEYEIIPPEMCRSNISIDIYKEYTWKECTMCKNWQNRMKCEICGRNNGFFLDFTEKKSGKKGFFHPVCRRSIQNGSLLSYNSEDNCYQIENIEILHKRTVYTRNMKMVLESNNDDEEEDNKIEYIRDQNEIKEIHQNEFYLEKMEEENVQKESLSFDNKSKSDDENFMALENIQNVNKSPENRNGQTKCLHLENMLNGACDKNDKILENLEFVNGNHENARKDHKEKEYNFIISNKPNPKTNDDANIPQFTTSNSNNINGNKHENYQMIKHMPDSQICNEGSLDDANGDSKIIIQRHNNINAVDPVSIEDFYKDSSKTLFNNNTNNNENNLSSSDPIFNENLDFEQNGSLSIRIDLSPSNSNENKDFLESSKLSKDAILIEVPESECESCEDFDNFIFQGFFKGAVKKDFLSAFSQQNIEKSVDELILNSKDQKLISKEPPFFKLMTKKELIVTTSSDDLPTPIMKKKMPNFESILAKIKGNPLYTFSSFIKDFNYLVHYALKYRCHSNEASNYITKQIRELNKLIENSQTMSKGKLLCQINKQTWRNLQPILLKNMVFKQISQPTSNNFRFYQQIHFYVPGIQQDNSLLDRIKAHKIPVQCPDNCCCFSLEKMGCFSLEKSSWKSKCPNRKENMECGYQSHKNKCENMAISLMKAKMLGVDVEERVCWGVDLYTKELLVKLLSFSIKDERKYRFIQYDLIKALNTQGENGGNLENAVKLIQEDIDGIFDEETKKIAKKTGKILNLGLTDDKLKAHCKGQGLICINPKGFQKNEFIIEYFGELYPPWKWFEKQDLIKKKMREMNQSNLLVDFYNIMLETHKNDAKGYSLLFVDPIHKGNFSSRLSHSCDPNCGTVTTVSNGNYIISMYAMKDISYGEELTFDYCSYTEDFNECKKAICLCGAKNCRGSYLEFAKTKEILKGLEQHSPFLKRQKNILSACLSKNLERKHEKLFDLYNIRENVLENCPLWLKIWISYVLKSIDEEKQAIYQTQPILATNISDNRLQNLVISVDKIKYFLSKVSKITKTSITSLNSPLKLMNSLEVFNFIWGTIDTRQFLRYSGLSPSSFIEDLIQTLTSNRTGNQLLENIINFVIITNSYVQMYAKTDRKVAILFIRMVLLKLSDWLKCLAKEYQNKSFSGDRDCHFLAISDILYFQAFTRCFFKNNHYPTVESNPVSIRRCELSNQQIYREKNENSLGSDGVIQFTDVKVYRPNFIWGQMMYWFKQDSNSPDHLLLNDRRGTLSYPNLNESFKRRKMGFPFLKISKKKVFDERKCFMRHLLKNKNLPWYSKAQFKWSFRKFRETQGFGTFLFDSVFYKDKIGHLFENVIEQSDLNFSDHLKLLKEFEVLMEDINELKFNELFESLKICEQKVKTFKNADIKRLLGQGGVKKKTINKSRHLDFKNKWKEKHNLKESQFNTFGDEKDDLTLLDEVEITNAFQVETGNFLNSENLKLEEEEIDLGN